MNRYTIGMFFALVLYTAYACTAGQLTPQAAQVVSLLCRVDAAAQPIAVALAPLAGAEIAALVSLEQTMVHPAAVQACAAFGGAKVVGRAVASDPS